MQVWIAGGGPAGSATAVGLARLGVEVTLVQRAVGRPALEGLSDRCWEALQRAGLGEAADCAGPAVVRDVDWGGRRGGRGRERLVERSVFDAALLRDADRAGVRILSGTVHSIRREHRAGDRAGDRDRGRSGDGHRGEASASWRCAGQSATGRGEPFAERAQLFVEARGRAAPGAAARCRGPQTLALARTFAPRPGVIAATALGTWPGGFAWVGIHGGLGVLQLFVEPSRRLRGAVRGLPAAFAQLAAAATRAAPHLGRLLTGSRFAGPVRARGAAPQLAGWAALPTALRVGDAAAASDPLAGNGIYWGLASAAAAVPTLNTLLHEPQRAALAQRFYRQRMEANFLHQVEVGRGFYGEETRRAAAPFFRLRGSWHPPIGVGTELELGPETAMGNGAGGGGLPRARLGVERRPVVADGFVVERELLVSAEYPEGIWRLGGVPAVPLLRALRAARVGQAASAPPGAMAPGAVSAERLAEALGQPQRRVEAALAWLRGRELLADKAIDYAPPDASQ